MLKALNNGATGLNAQQLKVDTLANNLANISTPGFKRLRVNFSELVSQMVDNNNIPTDPGNNDSITEGTGVRVADVDRLFMPGDVIKTGRLLDLAVQGEGFFQVVKGDVVYYTRDGSFSLDDAGNLVTPEGCRLDGIRLSAGSNKITVSSGGSVKAEEPEGMVEVGRIKLYKFTNMEGLKLEGGNLFSYDSNTGEVIPGDAASPGYGTIWQGFLETANVNPAEEMANLIETQRAYGFNARSVRTADEMWGMANNLRK